MKHLFSCFVVRMARLLLVAVLLILWNFSCISADPPFQYGNVGDFIFKPDEVNYRLPNNTKPETYDISITTDIAIGIFDFSGSVKIGVRALDKTDSITLHQRKLKIDQISLETEFGKIVRILPASYDPVTEFLTIFTTDEPLLPANLYFLTIQYKGTLRDDMGGFYRSSYTNSDGKKVYEFKFLVNFFFSEHFFFLNVTINRFFI